MPELSASGEIFRLNAQAGFDEGIVRGDVGAGARLKFEGHFELCHGLRAELSAQITADAQAHLAALFLLAGYAQGEALAAAGVRLDCAVQFDLFDSVGLTADAAVFAELAVDGRLSAGLTFEDAARAAQPLLSNLAYDLFIFLLNEIDAVAGVWGKAAFAAMAKARLNVRGSLADDANAGFVVEAGVEAGASAGAGYDMYAQIVLRNPKRFYLNSVNRITQELVTEARRALPAQFNPAIEGLELVLPIALHAAYELGQTLPLATLLPPDQAVGPLVDNCLAQLQRYTLQKCISVGASMLDVYVRNALEEAIEGLPAAQRSVVHQTALRLIAALQSSSQPEPADALSKVADLLDQIAPSEVGQWRQPLAVGWLAAASLATLRDGIGQAEASASGGRIGLGTAVASAVYLPLPDPPRMVRDEIVGWLGNSPSSLEFKHAVAYLGAIAADDLMDWIPGLREMLTPLLQPLGLAPGDFFKAVLNASFAADLGATELYRHLRAFLASVIDNAIRGQLIPALRAEGPANADFRLWLDQAAEPSLKLVSGFIFDRLDALAGGSVASSESA